MRYNAAVQMYFGILLYTARLAATIYVTGDGGILCGVSRMRIDIHLCPDGSSKVIGRLLHLTIIFCIGCKVATTAGTIYAATIIGCNTCSGTNFASIDINYALRNLFFCKRRQYIIRWNSWRSDTGHSATTVYALVDFSAVDIHRGLTSYGT